ncbi:hypothetical protein OE88DRAFT_1661143 [Heliocybe sulcata]|uniref:ISWI chromatin-remodeling complex ATPase ISW2 n=1 Tax=Heliocybe sulcata TaxID=5364 RepID=A0A5C3N9V9_9AGAM|nr:hypothetical protein OE88DRAFT_1661143 [Heliocybe sulcata]
MQAATETIDLTTSDDELDILNARSPSPKPAAMTSRAGRTLRPRLSENNAVETRPKRSLKRTVSDSTIENLDTTSNFKKRKGEEKKAVTIVVNAKRVAIEAARRRWIARHRHLFEPLLPASSNILDNVERELKDSTDKGAYIPMHQLDEQPKLVTGGTMKDYQLQGLSFLVWMYRNGMNCILGDEMGLGKTLQTLSLLAHVKENTTGPVEPHLIVCPLSVLSSWESECARWAPSFKVMRFHGSQSERARIKNAVRDNELRFDICVTTYDSYVVEDSWFKTRRWTYCVLDEGHKIKNAETGIAGKLQGLGALYRLILTGTPIHNNLLELWSLLHWLYPTVFTPASERLFKDSFDLSRGLYDLPFLTAAQDLLSTIMLRRTKATIEINVPPREELTVFIPLTEAQRFWTYRLLTRMDAVDLQQIFEEDGVGAGKRKSESPGAMDKGRQEVLRHLKEQMKSTKTGEKSQWKRLMNLLIQLRQVCDHPYLLPDAEPEPYAIGEHVVAASSKMVVIDKLLADILPKGERVLIFSQWTGMLDLLEDFMELRGIPYARLDGSTSRPRRALDIKLFQQEKSPYQVFLISTKAGGLGINLTKASTVIMCDSDWNPQNDLQAIARAHRIGQTKTVKVYRLICRGSVEDQMLDRIRRKLFLSVKVMGSDGSSADESTGFKSKELMDILRKGSSALTQNSNDMDLQAFLDAPISDIFDASRSREDRKEAKVKHELEQGLESAEDKKLLVDADEEEKALLTGIAQVQSRLFEGQYVPRAKPADNKQIAQEWHDLQKRARPDNIVTIGGMQFITPKQSSDRVQTKSIKPVAAKAAKKHEWEDWCVYCRDGGELITCQSCPRVFHPDCHGLTKTQLQRSPFIRCTQHACAYCSRGTTDAGGMLFRCQTCPRAFCEDCLPSGDMDAVGPTLPEFLLLGYGEKTSAYYIRCDDCRDRFKTDAAFRESWEGEFRETQIKVQAAQ